MERTETELPAQGNAPSSPVSAVPIYCPAADVLKLLSGKWKPQILTLASRETLRFIALVRILPEANKQSLTVALRELEEAQLLSRTVVQKKPLHVEYTLTELGRSMLSVYKLAGSLVANHDQ